MARRTTRNSSASQPPHERWPGVTIPIDDGGGRYWFDPDAADLACEFFPRFLNHYQGEFAGKSYELEPWQSELIIRPVFGWKRKSDNLRRFRKVYLEVAKKNGKSTMCAGIALLLLFCDGELGAEIYSAAADRDQATIVFRTAQIMVEHSPKLLRRCEIYKRSIVVPETLSSYKVLSADVKTKHGPNIHGLVFDELHAQPNRDLYETLAKGVAARRQPLTFEITTAGEDMESICREEHDYAENLINGVIEDESFLPVIFAAKPDDDWRKPEVWGSANPSLGITVKQDYLETECKAAIAEPRKQNAFKRLHLNIWTQQHDVWITLEDWDVCRGLLEADVSATPAFAGLDLSAKLDLTCFAVLVKRYDETLPALEMEVSQEESQSDQPRKKLNINFSVDLHSFFWIPEETMHKRAKADGVPYPLWVEQGFVTATPGNVVDYDYVYDQITREIAPRFNLKQIGFDPYNANQFTLQLQAAGFQMVEVVQAVKTMSEPSKVFEAMVLSRRIRHDGHPIMRWNVANVAVKEDKKENIFPYKQHSKKRIDGVIGSIIALSRAIVAPPPSVYETHGIESIG